MASGCFINPNRCANHIRSPFLTAAPGPRHITGMVAPLEHRQRIARLMPLDDVMRRIAERVHPVTPREMRAAAALGTTLGRTPQDFAAFQSEVLRDNIETFFKLCQQGGRTFNSPSDEAKRRFGSLAEGRGAA
jgi:hypothetical protein